MATWVSISKVEKFPAVRKQYNTNGAFRAAVAAEIGATSTWARRPPGVNKGSAKSASNLQVDVTAIPGVRALKRSGRPV